jgi:hypothetical protein
MALNKTDSGDVISAKLVPNNTLSGAGRVWGSQNGGVVSDGAHDNRNGADIETHDWAFYTTASNWKDAAWNADFWEWDNVNGRAKLK